MVSSFLSVFIVYIYLSEHVQIFKNVRTKVQRSLSTRLPQQENQNSPSFFLHLISSNILSQIFYLLDITVYFPHAVALVGAGGSN